YPTLEPLIGDRVNIRQIESQWEELLRLATSIRQGTVTASLVLRKLASYPRQNGLAWGLREIGRIDRTLFTLDWLQSSELRRRVTVGLNKGEAKNALSRAVCFHRRGMVQDRTFDDQRLRAGGCAAYFCVMRRRPANDAAIGQLQVAAETPRGFRRLCAKLRRPP